MLRLVHDAADPTAAEQQDLLIERQAEAAAEKAAAHLTRFAEEHDKRNFEGAFEHLHAALGCAALGRTHYARLHGFKIETRDPEPE